MRRQTFAPLSAGVVLLLGIAATATPQTPPPIPGETGTLALEGTMKKFYGGVNAIIVKLKSTTSAETVSARCAELSDVWIATQSRCRFGWPMDRRKRCHKAAHYFRRI
jgi:hypothetical protein